MKFDIIEFGEVTSTNDIASSGNYPHGTVVTARTQTCGRGQRGSNWESAPGENLLFSLVIRPSHIPAAHQFLISMAGALTASDALKEVGLDCMVKWPNDLYVGDRKIGGILIEHWLEGEKLSGSVIGIGINVRQRQFDLSLPNPTSVALETGNSDHSPGYILKMFCQAFEARYAQPADSLHSDYMSRLWRGTGLHFFRDRQGLEFRASVAGIDPLGGIMTLRLEDGSAMDFLFKEVKFV